MRRTADCSMPCSVLGGCAAPARGCACCTRQAMENSRSDIPEVRQAANQVVHCKCFDKNCANYTHFKEVCKKHKIDLSKY